MSVVYINSNPYVKDLRMTQVFNAIDAGAAADTLEICTAGYAAVLCIITLNKPSFTVAQASGAMTMAGVPKSGTASGTGTAAVARFKDSNANVIINSLTVGTSGSDINLNSTAITNGQTVTITSGTITHG